MQNDRMRDQNADDTTGSLPNVPDAGADSQPISPPEPVDISTAALNTHAALAAGTLNDDDDRSLYEKTLDAYEDSAADEPRPVPTEFRSGGGSQPRGARIYEER